MMKKLILFLLCISAFAQTSLTFKGPTGTSAAYALRDNPRVLLAGPSDPRTIALKDPDGEANSCLPGDAGCVAGTHYAAAFDSPTAMQMRWNLFAHVPGQQAGAGWDSPYMSAAGPNFAVAALMDFMCNQCVAREHFNGDSGYGYIYLGDWLTGGWHSMTWHDYMVQLIADMPTDKYSPIYYGGGSDWWQTADSYLLSDHEQDFPGFLAFGYSLAAPRLTTTQKTSLFRLVFNGYMNQPCDSRYQRRDGRVTAKRTSDPSYSLPGTITLTNGSDMVVGSGTNWTKALENSNIFLASNPGTTYLFGTVVDTTHLVLYAPYWGTTVSGQSYGVSDNIRRLTIHDASWHSDVQVGKWVGWRYHSRPYYRAGTATVTSGSSSVVGSGTTWTSAMVGMVFGLPRDPATVYTVATVTDGTHLTLTGNYAEANAAGAVYTINNPKDSVTLYSAWMFGKVTGIDGNVITVVGPSTSYGKQDVVFDKEESIDGYYATYDAWDETKHCGFGQHMTFNRPTPDMFYIAEQRLTTSSLPALSWPIALGGVSATVNYDGAAGWTPQNVAAGETIWEPSPTHPWNALIWNDVAVGCGGEGSTCGYYYPEHVLVTGRTGNTLTITRGKFTNAPFAQPIGSMIEVYTGDPEPQGAQFIRFPSQLENNTLNSFNSHLTMLLGFADQPTAQPWITKALNYYYDRILVRAKDLFTIWNYSGIGYGQGRGNMADAAAASIQNSFVGIDYWGPWQSERLGLFGHYLGAPWNSRIMPTWGTSANGGCVSAWNFFCPQGIARLGQSRGNGNLQFQNALYWFRYDSGAWAKFGWENYIQFAASSNWLEFWPAMWNMTQFQGNAAANGTYTDYRSTMVPSKIWSKTESGSTSTGPAGVPVFTGHSTLASKTNWNHDATQLWGYFLSGWSDKLNSVDPISTYTIGKGSASNIDANGFLINHDVELSTSDGPLSLVHQNTVDFGTVANTSSNGFGGYSGTPISQDIRGTVNSSFTYGRANVWQAYAFNNNNDMGVTRAYRNFVHLKSGKEFIIVHDDLAVTAAKRMRSFVHYPNNGETLKAFWDADYETPVAAYTEGTTTSTTGFGVIDSRGPVSKVLTTWKMPASGSDWKIYDLNVRQDSNEYLAALNNGLTQTVFTFYVGPDCTNVAPCRVHWADGTERTVGSPTTVNARRYVISSYLMAPNATEYVRVYMTKAGVLTVRPSVASITVTCGADLTCASYSAADFAADDVRLARNKAVDWSAGAGTFSLLQGSCPGGTANQSGNYNEWDACVGFSRIPNDRYHYDSDAADRYGTARVVFFDAGTDSTEAQIVLVHRPTATMDETADTQTTLTVTGTGGNYIGTQISGSDSAVIITPKNTLDVGTGVSYTGTHSGTARLVVAGLQSGNYSVTGVAPTQIADGDNALYVAGVAAGAINVTRTGALTLGFSSVSPITTASVGTSFAYQFSASGGTSPLTFSLSSGSAPDGLTLASTGILSGTPTTPGTYTLHVRVTDATPAHVDADFVLVVQVAGALTLSPGSLPSGTVGTAYSQALTASGGTSPYSYAITSGALPTSLTLSSGTIAGTPTVAGSGSVTITVTDAASATASRAYSWTIADAVAQAPVFSSNSPLTPGAVGTAYAPFTFACQGGTAPYTYSKQSGTLPTGMSLAGAVLSGTPTASGDYSFTMRCTDSQGTPQHVDKTFALTIAGNSPVVPNAEIVGKVASSVSTTLTVIGGTPSYTFSVLSSSCPWASVSANGVVSGTPAAAITCTVRVLVTDGAGQTTTADVTATIVEHSGVVTMTAEQVAGKALVRYRLVGLAAETVCTVTAVQDGAVVASSNDTGGIASRVAVLSGLTAGLPATVRVSCGAFNDSTSTVVPVPMTGTASYSYAIGAPPARMAATQAVVDYGTSYGTLTATDPVSCAAGCTVIVPTLTRGGAYYMRHRFLNVSNATVGTAVAQQVVIP